MLIKRKLYRYSFTAVEVSTKSKDETTDVPNKAVNKELEPTNVRPRKKRLGFIEYMQDSILLKQLVQYNHDSKNSTTGCRRLKEVSEYLKESGLTPKDTTDNIKLN